MRWVAFWFETIIKEDERGFLTRDGVFQRLLPPGRRRLLDLRRSYNCETVDVVQAEFPAERAMLYARQHPAVAAENFEIVQCGPNEVAIVLFDGNLKHIVLPNTTRAFWKVATRVEVEKVDTAANLRVAKRDLDRINPSWSACIVRALVEPHQTGLLMVDGQLVERLPPGRYAFWNVARVVRVETIDLRPQPLEITAQEILTKDRVGIRVTLTAFVRIVDPEAAMLASADVPNMIYKLVQFAIREAVAARTLDDILGARDTLDGEVRAYVGERAKALGAEVREIGVKDVILPGDVRELLNKVVEAERVARANNIRRQEETASTRSLLNTAKLMENNPLLLRLKELEALEKLVEKVGRIDMHTGHDGIGALLSKLYTLAGPDGVKPDDGPGDRAT